jgi:hypothetical protein
MPMSASSRPIAVLSTQSDSAGMRRFDDFFRLTHDRKHYGPELLDSLQGIVDYVKSLDTAWLSTPSSLSQCQQIPRLTLLASGDITEHQLLDVVLKTRNNMFNVFRSSSISLGW